MKKLSYSTLSCGVLIGLLAPLGAANAYDEHNRIQQYLGEPTSTFSSSTMAAKTGSPDGWSGAQGAQGPIRSDMTEDKAVENERALQRRELDKKLFPLNAEGS